MTDAIAVALVVDSSLGLLAEWHRVMIDYIIPLLQRLYDGGRQLRIAFVCYAPSLTHPTPLLAKMNFAPHKTIMQDLKDEPRKLGVGRTGSGAGRGMAVLEGLVAALELIDIVKSTPEKPSCHIIHIATSPPDAAERPLWNVTQRLDSVTWDTLPHEVQKRDVRYSSVLLQPISKLSSFYSAVAGSSSQLPWFPVRSHHAVNLSGYPAPKGLKRPNDPTPPTQDASPDAKRPRIAQERSPQMTGTIPQQPGPASASQTHQTFQPPPPQSQGGPPTTAPTNPSAPRTNQPPPLTPETLQKAVERVFETERNLRQRLMEAMAHQQAGRVQEADAIKAQVHAQFLQVKKMKAVLEQYQAKVLPQSAVQNPNNNNNAGPPPPGNVSGGAPATEVKVEVPRGDPAPPAPPPPVVPPSESLPSQHQQARTPRMNHATVPQVQPPVTTPTALPASQTPGQAGSQGVQTNSKHWEGTLAWRGLEHTTHTRTELQTRVILTYMPSQELALETWPATMNLTPSKERAISWFLLQDWLKRQSATIFTLNPRETAGEDKSRNEDNFRGLIKLLAEKKIYAMSGWNGPGGREQQIVIFPVKTGLGGGFFSHKITEMPPTQICDIELESIPPPMAIFLSRLTPQHLVQLSQYPLEQRKKWLQVYTVQQAAQQKRIVEAQAATQAQQQPAGGITIPQPGAPGTIAGSAGPIDVMSMAGTSPGNTFGGMGGVSAHGSPHAGMAGMMIGKMDGNGMAGIVGAHQRTGSGTTYEAQPFVVRPGQGSNGPHGMG